MDGKAVNETPEVRIRRLEEECSSLRSENADLRRTMENYHTAVEHSLVGICVIQHGRFQYVNGRLVEMTGHSTPDELIGRRFRELVHPDDAHQMEAGLPEEADSPCDPARCTFRFLKRDGSVMWVEAGATRVTYQGSPAVVGNIVDITELKESEEALRQSQRELMCHRQFLEDMVALRTADLEEANAKLLVEVAERKQIAAKLDAQMRFSESLINGLPGIFYVFRRDGHLLMWNKKSEEVTEYDVEAIPELELRDFFVAQDQESVLERVAEVFATGSSTVEAGLRTKSGKEYPYYLSGALVEHQGETYLVGLGVDITERKLAEDALARSEQRLRFLSAQLISAQEQERQRVARELHDGIGQILTAIKFRVEKAFLEISPIADPGYRGSLEGIVPMIQEAVDELGRISMDLRPATLDDFGILTTMQWFCDRFQATFAGIRVHRELALDESEIPEPYKIVMFRVLQEALNNVVKHSDASDVTVSLKPTDGSVQLTIEDNGVGFDVDSALTMPGGKRGFGLTNMRERTELSGGSFRLDSESGGKTVLTASWPAVPKHPSPMRS